MNKHKLSKDVKRMMAQAKTADPAEARDLVLRAYLAGIRDASSELLVMAQDFARESEGMD